MMISLFPTPWPVLVAREFVSLRAAAMGSPTGWRPMLDPQLIPDRAKRFSSFRGPRRVQAGLLLMAFGLRHVPCSVIGNWGSDYYGHPRSTQQHEHRFFDDMHSFIAAMAKRFPIHLAITVGHPAMIATGPLGGHTIETGLVIASTDALSADIVGARLLGFRAQAVRHLWEASRLGIGESDTERRRFPKLSLSEAIGAFTEAAYGKRLDFEHA